MTDQMVTQAAETQPASSPRWLNPGKGIQWLLVIAGLIGRWQHEAPDVLA